MNGLSLQWFQDHPYVLAWRATDSNSYFPTVQSLNSQLNVDINCPITVSRVDNIVNQYLTLLVRDIRYICTKEKLPRSRKTLCQRFNLNKTEINYVTNKFNKDE